MAPKFVRRSLPKQAREWPSAEHCGVVSMEGWRRFDDVSNSELLTVAVFAGLSGRTDLLGLFFVYLLALLSHSLNCPASALLKGKQAEKEKSGLTTT